MAYTRERSGQERVSLAPNETEPGKGLTFEADGSKYKSRRSKRDLASLGQEEVVVGLQEGGQRLLDPYSDPAPSELTLVRSLRLAEVDECFGLLW
jgi:hypothetical protein